MAPWNLLEGARTLPEPWNLLEGATASGALHTLRGTGGPVMTTMPPAVSVIRVTLVFYILALDNLDLERARDAFPGDEVHYYLIAV